MLVECLTKLLSRRVTHWLCCIPYLLTDKISKMRNCRKPTPKIVYKLGNSTWHLKDVTKEWKQYFPNGDGDWENTVCGIHNLNWCQTCRSNYIPYGFVVLKDLKIPFCSKCTAFVAGQCKCPMPPGTKLKLLSPEADIF